MREREQQKLGIHPRQSFPGRNDRNPGKHGGAGFSFGIYPQIAIDRPRAKAMQPFEVLLTQFSKCIDPIRISVFKVKPLIVRETIRAVKEMDRVPSSAPVFHRVANNPVDGASQTGSTRTEHVEIQQVCRPDGPIAKINRSCSQGGLVFSP